MSKAKEMLKLLDEAMPGAPTVIVVEDDPVFLEIMRDAFAKAGLKVQVATDVDTAKRLIADDQQTVAFMVIDSHIGNGKGDDVAQAARAANVGPLFLFASSAGESDASLYDGVYEKQHLLGMLSDLLLGKAQEGMSEELIESILKGIVSEIISHEGGKWLVKSKKGKVLGSHDTKADAMKQLAAVEISKHGG